MRRMMAALVLMLAPSALRGQAPPPAPFGTQTLFGCGVFSCHQMTVTTFPTAPHTIAGGTFTRAVRITFEEWLFEKAFYRAVVGPFAMDGPYRYRAPIGNGNQLAMIWDQSWAAPPTCADNACIGYRTHTIQGPTDESWHISAATIQIF